MARKATTKDTILGFMLLGALIFTLVKCAGSEPERPMTEAERAAADVHDAKIACRGAIDRALNDPASAEWQVTDAWPSKVVDKDNIRTIALLSAKNGFGALMKMEVKCDAHREADGWRAAKVEQQ